MTSNNKSEKLFRILLVEDNAADSRLIRQALDQYEIKFELEIISDGEAALLRIEDLQSTAANRYPDLIIVDLNVPRHDGKEVLRALRSSKLCAVVPVVVFSSSEIPQDEADSLQLGACRYVKKPIDLDEFMEIGEIIKQILLAPRTN